MCNTVALFPKVNITVADCMPVSSLLKTIQINGSVECTWFITKYSDQ